MKLLLLDRPKDKTIITGRQVEFFGPWAQPINSPQDLSRPAFEPYPDAYSVYNASSKVINIAQDILRSLARILPDLTGVKRGERFWRLFLGHHVVLLAGIIEDIKIRHLSLPEKEYILGLPSNNYSQDYIPRSWSESLQLIAYDDYFRWYAMTLYLKNYYRNCEFVEYLRIPARRITSRQEEFLQKIFRSYPRIPRKLGFMLFSRMGIFKKEIMLSDKICSLIWDRYHLEDLDFSKLDACLLPEGYLSDIKLPPSLKIDEKKRKSIAESFPYPYGELLSLSLPLIALEGLVGLLNLIDHKKNHFFKNIKRVYTHGQAFLDEGAKRALLALLADDGKKIVSVQHGCAHAYFAHSGMFPERMIADENICWGPGFCNHEQFPNTNKIKALNSIYLFNIKQESLRTRRNKWDVLFVVLEENRYIKWLYSPLFPDLAFDYFKREKVLFDYFRVSKNVAIKVYPETHGWGQYDWIKSNYPAVTILKTGRFVNYAINSKIVIIDYIGTSFLEMLAMQRPFLATWNRRWFKGTNRFEEFIDRLIEVGVFYEHPEPLIKAYNEEISADVTSWWNDTKRQATLTEMANNFAMTSDTVYEEWTNEFQTK